MLQDLPHPFALTVAGEGPAAVVRLHGELDIAAEAEVTEQLNRVLDTMPQRLTVDLRDLVFLDSTGLRALLRLRESCAATGCSLLLVRGTPSVHRVLEVSGVAAHFAMVDDDVALAPAA